MLVIVDYGMGNLRSVQNAFEAIGAKVKISSEPSDIVEARAIVVPGVGAFGDGMQNLRERNLIDVLNEQVLVKKKPFLGICLGMQFLARTSDEHGENQGLGWLPGDVKLITPGEPQFRVPHIGWNSLQIRSRHPLFDGIEEEPVFYFVHSHHFEPSPGEEGCVSAVCGHGQTITAAVQKDNILGVQFHPEKSQKPGLKLLENFLKVT